MNSEFQVPRADNALIGNPEFESTRAALLAPPITLSTPARQIVARTSFSPGVFPLGLSPREKNPPGVLPSVGGFLRRWYRWFPQGLAFAAIFWSLCFHVSQVRGSSMYPGILNSDRIVVDDFFYHLFPMGRGDVVVLKYPLDHSLDYVKRVVGLPGDDILIAFGKVWVNGEALEEPYLDAGSIDHASFKHCTVASDHFFVLGDNRIHSSDSREFGQVPMDCLQGIVRARLWPFGRAGWVN
jgi:signal peptidase I